MNELVIKDKEILEIAQKLSYKLGTSIENVIRLALRCFIDHIEEREITKSYTQLIEEIERMSATPSFSVTVIQEYLKKLANLKEKIKELNEINKAKVIEGIGVVEFNANTLHKMGKIVIRYCDKVIFHNDVEIKLLDQYVLKIIGVNVIKAPRKLHPVLLTKTKLCGKICDLKEEEKSQDL